MNKEVISKEVSRSSISDNRSTKLTVQSERLTEDVRLAFGNREHLFQVTS